MKSMYYMPPEWNEHASTWIAWPHNKDDWPGKFAPIDWVYTEITRRLIESETVNIIVRDSTQQNRVIKLLDKSHGYSVDLIKFHVKNTDRSWLRDTGPTFVFGNGEKGRLCGIEWRFNGWAKYNNFKSDSGVSSFINRRTGATHVIPIRPNKKERVVLEGGAIDVDGSGLVMATEECLLGEKQERNPRLSKERYESVFGEYLGARQTIWLKNGIVGDDTHGHIDDIARFVGPRKVIACVEKNNKDENYKALAENLDILNAFKAIPTKGDQVAFARGGYGARLTDGARLEIIELPMPSPVIFDGNRLPASYANFYIANKMVIVPTFNDEKDREALEIIAGCFPSRRVIGINCTDLIWGLGTIHCLTQQEPAANIFQ